MHDRIVGLETETWEALKESGAALIPFLSADCIMIFPGAPDLVSATSSPPLHDILTKQEMKPWESYRMKDVHVIPLGAEAAIISYKVRAERDDAEYRAMVSSVWRDVGDGWRLVMHQQTPEA